MNARSANLWTYANVVKYSLYCCVRSCNSSVKCGFPKCSFSEDVILL
nr:unnamed protein product [Callosobruchus chinensis]